MVKINEEPEEAQKNQYADLDYLSDDSSTMMVQVSNSKQVNNHRYQSSREGRNTPCNNHLN
jgi:hypothetical protein